MPLAPSIQKIVPSDDNVLINFDFIDYATGTGYATYYAGTASGANVLSNNTFNSNNLNTNAAIASNGYIQLIDVDFDVEFNVPQDIKGEALVTVPLGFQVSNSSSGSPAAFFVAKIRKWDGTTETDLAEGSSSQWLAGGLGGAGNFKYNIKTARIPISKVVHFARGEKLRLTINGYARETVMPNFNKQFMIYHDPANRQSNDGESYNNALASGASILKLQLPIRIDS